MLLPFQIWKNIASSLTTAGLFILVISQNAFAHPDGNYANQTQDPVCRTVFVKHTYTLGGDIYSVNVNGEDGQTVEYARTNRGVFDLYLHLGSNVLSLKNLIGKKILDAGTGDGQFVEDLRNYGIEAEGLDLVLNKTQKTKPYFFEKDMAHTGLPSATYDTVFSIWSTLTYESEKQNLFRIIASELKRLLKPGGRLIIFPVHSQLMISRMRAKTPYRREFDHRRNEISIRPKGKIYYDNSNMYGRERVYPSFFATRNLTTLAKLGFNVQIFRDKELTTYEHLIVIATKNSTPATIHLSNDSAGDLSGDSDNN